MNKSWGIVALVVAGAYWLQAVLIPLALAVLLTFLLSPVVSWLQRRGLGRVPSVLVTVLLALSILGGIGWTLTHQLVTLADQLPRYSLNIRHRIADLRGASKGGSVEKVQKAMEDVVGEIQKTDTPGLAAKKPVAVVLEPPSILAHLPSLLQALASSGVVTVLVIFMLLERRELRDRVILLIGYRRMTATTRALDEAGARISRYLLMQSIINGSFGVAVGLGLFLIGVPYAVTWGALAAALRFIPYLGAFVAMLLPLAVSLAVFPGWLQPALVAGLLLAVELVTGSVMEPWLYGQSAGVSPVALLVALTFWTWFWGPVGLLIATPLTVCLVVLGKHLPALGFLVVLMGDRPVIEAKARYYQRLLARDQDEATDIAEAYVNTDGRESVYDTVLLPALYYARQDRDRGLLSEGDAQFVGQATQEILDVIAQDAPAISERDPGDHPATDTRIRIVGCPARDEVDVLALEMVQHLLDPARYRMEVSKPARLVGEVLAGVDLDRPAILCIGAVAPGGLSQARHLCKRLRLQCPGLTIVVGRWGPPDEQDADRQHLLAAGADHVATTVLDTQRALIRVGLTHGQPAAESPPTSASVGPAMERPARAFPSRVPVALLLGVTMLGLAQASCARVQSHYGLPDLAAQEPSFLPTIEGYTSAAHGGNTASLLLNGDQIFPAQLGAIRSARQTISYAQYFYEEGPIGGEIAEALAERCRAGVRGHILLDGFGTLGMPAAYRETMTAAGCEVATFRPLTPLTLLSAVGFGRDHKRNHRRMLIVDGQIGFTGGSGVSPKWMGDGRTEGRWRDTDVRIEGPIVARLQGAFVENWLEATGNVLGGDAYFPPLHRRGAVSAQIVRSSPAAGSFSMYTMFLLAMSSARRSIYITNPYFLPDARMTRVLTEAPRRGVRVVVLLPGAIDNNIVRQASRSQFGALLEAGIEIYEYQAGLLHAKTMTIDGIWATIGSTNLDTRSFAFNEEVNAVLYNQDVAGQLEKIFADDLTFARKVDAARWRRRGVVNRLLEILSVPVRDQL